MKPRSSRSLEGPWATAEDIAARDLNNLYLTSSFFAEPQRYSAFCALYAVMRVVDDRIDEIPARGELSPESRQHEHAVVDAWRALIRTAHADRAPAPEDLAACESPLAGDLISTSREAMRMFPVPLTLWENFFVAMHQDIDSSRFATYDQFLGYTEGASVAPTTIYLYLIAAERRDAAELYVPPAELDLIACGRQLGIFAYLGHILRDLAQDLATGDEGLLYLAASDMATHGVSEESLRHDLERGQAAEPLRALVRSLAERSRQAYATSRQLLTPLDGRLSGDRAFILELIVTIYKAIVDKVEACDFDPMQGRHRLTLREKQKLTRNVAKKVGYDLPVARLLALVARR